ncbi:hypothetical protein HWE04_10765 [Herbaspirillum sp. C7C2]|uniref:hypothetical protein n=1 Tax=Herbaspirillum sp. C7C2 TaxID=2736666 RepID=UPI001F51EFB5|nr:hypothetical protein [Herbaspirillum sp. C7C2]MCI1014332.1 hypothetical protein [Herbaspirillum sp. C7C2]
MTIKSLLIGAAIAAPIALYCKLILIPPDFWHGPVDVVAFRIVSEKITVFKNRHYTQAAFEASKGMLCYRLEDDSHSFVIVDFKDATTKEFLLLCPGYGAGWSRDGI